MAEQPPLGQLFVLSFDANNESFPIVAMHKDATVASYLNSVPEPWSACPYSDKDGISYPNNLYVGETRYSGNQRAIWKWLLLPGPWLYEYQQEPDSLAFVFTKRRHAVPQNIREFVVAQSGSGATATATLGSGSTAGQVVSIAISGGAHYGDFFGISVAVPGSGQMAVAYGTATGGVPNPNAVVTFGGRGYSGAPACTVLPNSLVDVRREDIDSYLAWEIVKITTDSPYHSFDKNSPPGTALASQKTQSYVMPARINVINMIETGLQEESTIDPRADFILVNVFDWWVISATQPDLPSDPILPSNEISVRSPQNYNINLGDFRSVLNDAFATFAYGAFGTIFYLFFPASSPSFSEYEGTVFFTIPTTSVASGAPTSLTWSGPSTLAVGDVIFGQVVASIDSGTTATTATAVPFPSGTTTLTTTVAARNGTGWIGTYKVIDSESVPLQSPYRWRCRAVQALMY